MAKAKKRAKSRKTVARRAPSSSARSATTREQTFLLWFAVALFVLAVFLVFTNK